MKVTIAPDFESLLPPLSDAELAQLEQNCLDDPKHENMPPVILWSNHKNTLVDGHNQNRVRTKHNLKIKYVRRDFDSRDDAKRFALDVQFGRRNLDASQRAMAYAKLPRKTEGKPKANSANLQSIAELAESAGVSERTMADAVKVADKAPAAVAKAVAAGEVKVSDAAAVAELPKAEQSAALKQVTSGKAKTLRAAVADTPSPEPKADRQWGEGDSLDDVQADLKEVAKRCKQLSQFIRTVLRCEENDIARPYCGNYSLLTLSHPLLHVARCVKNDMPVGGSPKKPVLFWEAKAKELAGK